MTILGLDMSTWSALSRTPVDISEQGYDFLFYKVSKGSSYQSGINGKDKAYGDVPRAAIHVQTDDSAQGQAYNILTAVNDVSTPIILEVVAGDTLTTQDIITNLVAEGYRVPLMYLPFWYWAKAGQPDLSTLPPLWGACRVPGAGIGRDIYRGVPASSWANYGNSTVIALHYTQDAYLEGVEGPVNVSAFAGTRENLEYLLFSDNVLPHPSMVVTDKYTVRATDTLWSIAAATLGDPAKAIGIAIENNLADLDRLMPGQTLTIGGWNGRYHTGIVRPSPYPRVVANSSPDS